MLHIVTRTLSDINVYICIALFYLYDKIIFYYTQLYCYYCAFINIIIIIILYALS